MEHTSDSNGAAPGHVVDGLPSQAEAHLQAARDALEGLDKKARRFIRERPGLCVLGAVALGFMVGRFVSRR